MTSGEHCRALGAVKVAVLLTSVKRRALRHALELKLRRCRGDMLQHFLGDVMTKVHGDNFVRASAFYSQGDLKCDGLLRNPLTVFACYGPNNGGDGLSTVALAKAVSKVAEDFNGAVKHWPDLKQWIFVSNFVSGVPPHITQEVMKLQKANPNRSLKLLGLEQFEKIILDLELDDIEDLIGDAATDEDFRQIQIPEVQSVIDDVMAAVTDGVVRDDQPIEVPAEKLEFNKLPAIYCNRLKQGFQSAGRVATYLLDHPDPTLDGRMAGAFKGKYLELKAQGFLPGEIMDELYDFALGGHRNTTPREVAVWGLLAHLFEKCTIFEDDPSKVVAA